MWPEVATGTQRHKWVKMFWQVGRLGWVSPASRRDGLCLASSSGCILDVTVGQLLAKRPLLYWLVILCMLRFRLVLLKIASHLADEAWRWRSHTERACLPVVDVVDVIAVSHQLCACIVIRGCVCSRPQKESTLIFKKISFEIVLCVKIGSWKCI